MDDLDFSKNPSEIAKSAKTRFCDYWMIQIFPGQTAVYVSCPYGREHSCKKLEKSLERFSWNIGNQLTNQLTTVTFCRTCSTTVEWNFWLLRLASYHPLIDEISWSCLKINFKRKLEKTEWLHRPARQTDRHILHI